MGSKTTPPPETPGLTWRGWSFVALYSGALFGAWQLSSTTARAYIVLFALPALFFVVYQLYGKALLLAALLGWQPHDVRGVLVYSDSPNWADHIDQQWIPRLGDCLRILNWSRRRNWRKTLAVRIFHHYVGTSSNFNPSVVLLRGLRTPLVFRCFYAFRDAKHNNWQALERIEKRLFEELNPPVA